MKSIAVIGCGFGDEGKGRVVSDLCRNYYKGDPLVVRFCGGHQAGHHVVISGFDHVFSNFGSGSVYGIPTYWSKYCTVDPVGIITELELLMGKHCEPTLFIDGRCPVTTPYDKQGNFKREKILKHGTCGVGFGNTLQREEDYFSLLFEDLFFPTVLKTKLNLIKNRYYSHLFVDDREHNFFMKSCKTLTGLSSVQMVKDLPKSKLYIFEGSQGLLLDQNFGFFPHVTRSNTGTKNILEMGFEPEIILVSRAYQTRHGHGPMTNENLMYYIKGNPFEVEDPGSEAIRGRFRRSLLDLDLIKYAISKDEYISRAKSKSIYMTCLDVVHPSYMFTIEAGEGTREIFSYEDQYKFAEAIQQYLRIKTFPLPPIEF